MSEWSVEYLEKMPDALLVSFHRAVSCQSIKYGDSYESILEAIEAEIAKRGIDPDKIRGDTGFGTRP
jgi:hypothetical protein